MVLRRGLSTTVYVAPFRLNVSATESISQTTHPLELTYGVVWEKRLNETVRKTREMRCFKTNS
jgi:hypothetical protein